MIKSSLSDATHSLSSSSGISTLRSGRSCSGSGWATTNNSSSNNMNRSKNSTSSLAFLFNRQSSISTTGGPNLNSGQNQNAMLNDMAHATAPISLANNISISFAPILTDSHALGNGNGNGNVESDQYLTSMLFDSYLEFPEFVNLFKSFYIHMRKDLKDIFDRYAILVNSKDTCDQNFEQTWQSIRKLWKNLIYKNNQSFLNQQQQPPTPQQQQQVGGPSFADNTDSDIQTLNDQLTSLTRNNLSDELELINSFKNLIDSSDATMIGSKTNLSQVKEKYKDLLFHLQNQLVIMNNNRLFYDLIASNSISPYTVNCSSDLLLLNYFR